LKLITGTANLPQDQAQAKGKKDFCPQIAHRRPVCSASLAACSAPLFSYAAKTGTEE